MHARARAHTHTHTHTGLRNAGGVQTAVQKNTFYSVEIAYFCGKGRVAQTGDAMLLAPCHKKCDALTAAEMEAGKTRQ